MTLCTLKQQFNLICVINVIFISISKSTIYHVDPANSVQSGNGRTWNNAFTSLDIALSTAKKLVDEIWLKGPYTYTPSTTNRSNCFVAALNAQIYGGFIGTESLISERPTSNFDQYESIISGDININNDNSDNCYHVLQYNKILTLDRVTIMYGYANGNGIDNYGGALITSDPNRKTELYLTHVKFMNNTAINGGALWFESTDVNSVKVTIINCFFQYNIAKSGTYEGGYGAAIYLYFLSNVTISNTIFINNQAEFRGGAIYQDYGAILTCVGCTFTSNSASYGGAIFSEDRNSQTEGTFPLIKSSIFTSNIATIYGGGICWFNGVIGTLINNQFNDNEASKGGAIAVINAQITTTDISNTNTFSGNSDNIYNETAVIFDGIDPNVQDSIFTDVVPYMTNIYDRFSLFLASETNIYPYSSFNELCYVNINNLNSTQSGDTWNNAFNDIQDCIDKLSVFASGGEIWVAQGVYNPTRVPLWKQRIGKIGPQSYSFTESGNIRMYGGFDGTETLRQQRNFKLNPTYLSCNLGSGTYCNQIVQGADGTLIDGFIFIETQYSDNTRRRLANSISVQEVLASTSGSAGGGIYSNSTDITVVNSVFYGLFSSGKGGAVYCIGQQGNDITNIKSPTFFNVAFIQNRANIRGGAISADVSCNFICEYCTFDGNSCAKKGGAIYLDFDSDPTIYSSTFTNNYALESGGCIAADGKSMTTFIDAEFSNNYAQWDGGCLYSGSGVSKGIEQGFIFYGNTEFHNNYLINAATGQSDIYGWPFSTIHFETGDYNPYESNEPMNSKFNISAPNIILFVVDDLHYIMDWVDYAPGINLRGEQVTYLEIPLPHIAEFMTEGVVFPRSYAGGPKCSPSRFSTLTGRYVTKGKYAIDRTLKTTSGINGINVTIQTSKLFFEDSYNNIPYQLQNAVHNAYYTGFVGKWHLNTADDNGYNYGCTQLNTHMDRTLYDLCADIIKAQGFDVVDGFYDANIDAEPVEFSHNPEWKVDVATKFMDEALLRDEPFFLYFASTLTHEPKAEESLFDFDVTKTPKGILTGNDIPSTTMDSRSNIWARALNLSYQTSNRNNFAALDIWMDESFGALVTYLKSKGIYDETLVVLLNDHGMGAKGVLYEQGARIVQFVRFPPLFGKEGHVMNNFITSNVDLAAVIFELSGITLDGDYELDGRSWVTDVILAINGDTVQPECCQSRHIDVYNSHAIVTQDWKYIYRATKHIEVDGDPGEKYKFSDATEQLYNLNSDANEQINLINNESNIDVITSMKQQMIKYITDMCEPLNITCKTPHIIDVITNINVTTTEDIDTKGDMTGDRGNGGMIAAVVICVVFGILFIVLGAVYYYKKVYTPGGIRSLSDKLKVKVNALKSTGRSPMPGSGGRESQMTPHGIMTSLSPKAKRKIQFSPHMDENSLDGLDGEFPDIILANNSKETTVTTTNQMDKTDEETDELNECTQCGKTRKGKIDDNDGNFYCNECWNEFENDRNANNVATVSDSDPEINDLNI